ncbi:MAG: pitrilysin family protein [Gemmatimonadetes bacterium]|nr:pitrilysin family protein [Gemmatimonadota bacterium]MDA1104190.1 pitrilysin family protein [Gemmatimonadota bacterium]
MTERLPPTPLGPVAPALRAATLWAAISCAASVLVPSTTEAQSTSTRDRITTLSVPALDFEQPEASRYDVRGVDVVFMGSHELPLVSIFAHFRGGYGLFDRGSYAASMGLPAMLRYGGSTTLSPDSVDDLLEFLAVQTSFGSAGGSVTSTMNTLTEHLETAIDVWGDMLANPGFDSAEIAAWRGRQLEGVTRRPDDPSRLAFSEFNRLLYGDHPIGWEMDISDLAEERVTPARFRAMHEAIVCRDNLVLGVTGDVGWSDAERLLERLVERIPACASELPESPIPDIRRAPGVFVIEKDLEQSVIVMAHPTDVRQSDDVDYFSATIGNAILGSGGFSSRLVGRIRTEEGFAYSASSVWTTPREHEGILGAITRTRPENTVPAIEAILQTMAELRDEAPTDEEVATTVDQIVNGFVFNFDSPGQIVSRSVFFLAQELPDDWLERYWRGVQEVTPESVQRVFGEHLRPEAMTILIVGDPIRIGWSAIESLGPVTVLPGR